MKENPIHKQVRQAYAEAVTSPGTGCGCGGKGTAVQWAGYDSVELSSLPKEAVESSFGCGNPLAFSDVQPGQTVLDLGCGAGIDLLIASRRVGPKGRVIGVDMTSEMLAEARRNLERAGAKNIDLRKGVIEDLPLESQSVDWVISNCVINLSPDKPKVFAEIARVLRPGGTMQVSDLVSKDLPEWALKSVCLYNSCISGAISEEKYIAGLRDAGLTGIVVLERLAYDGSQIEEIAKSEMSLANADEFGLKKGEYGEILTRIKSELAGKVMSIKIRAHKPLLSSGSSR